MDINTPPQSSGKIVIASSNNKQVFKRIVVGVVAVVVLLLLGIGLKYVLNKGTSKQSSAMMSPAATMVPSFPQDFASQSGTSSGIVANTNSPFATSFANAAQSFSSIHGLTSLSATIVGQVKTSNATNITIATNNATTNIPVNNGTGFLDLTKSTSTKAVPYTAASVASGDYVIVQLSYTPAPSQVVTTVTKIPQSMYTSAVQQAK